MNRSLHMKLVLIMLLLIISLMAVACAFLVRGVQGFYNGRFYSSMHDTFAMPEFSRDLRAAAAGENAPEKLNEILGAYSGQLGIDFSTRHYYVLSGRTGEPIVGSGSIANGSFEITPNILTAIEGAEGDDNSATETYMDIALPIEGSGGNRYIIYIRDSKQTVQDLNMELFFIIIQSLVIGLIISILLSFVLSKTMVNPIQSLTRAAERVAGGDFSEKIEVGATDEIGVLTRTFNNMATQLHDTLDDIESERDKLSTVFRYMTDGLIAFSRDGKIIQYNPASERMLGVDLGTQERDYFSLFGDLTSMEDVFDKSDNFTADRSIGNRDLEIVLASFASEGAQGGILAVLHDVTEQKKSDAMRREFVANVSHELRTPITNIRSYTETLIEAPDIPDEMEENFLKVILSESDRMTKIVQDLLSLSKFDAGSESLVMEPFDMAKSVQDVCSAITIEAAKHGHTMTLHCADGLPPVNGDRSRIEQVIVNVISNAVKYTPDGGKIDVSVTHGGGFVRLAVQDNGIGIPKEDLPRIFERFYRVDKARSRASGGTGLGLSIAQEIVRLHGGEISIDSDYGKGTLVTVSLPAAKSESR